DLSTQPLSHSESNDSDNPTISSLSNSLNNDPQTHTYWRPSNDLQKLYNKVPTCNFCKKPETRFSFPYFSPMPEEITSVPLHMRKCLLPAYLHCSLGRIPNSNPYSEYRSLTRTMGYSRNFRALALYSGTLGAFLDPDNNNNLVNNSNYNQTLQCAANWLSENNPYLRPFSSLLLQNQNGPFPIAQHSQTNNEIPLINSHEII
ncbi:4324_t:CDS:2, partial [Gigaspora margarita]